MIEINLLPGDAKKKKRAKATSGSGLKLEFHPAQWLAGVTAKITDKYMLGAVAAAGVSGALIVLLFISQTARATMVEARETQAVKDSAQYSAVLTAKSRAEAARDRAKKARADSLFADAKTIKFKIVGHTVDIQALTRFMTSLEASPFIQNVQLSRSDLVQAEGKEVTEFTLEAETQPPPPFAIKTVPLIVSAVH